MNSEANARRIAMVEACFGTSGQPLAIPMRVLVGEGVLTKMCRKKPKPRQFFLFNDILVYGNILINKKKYNKQHIIALEAIKLENLDDDGVQRNGWLMCTPTKSFAVYAATATEKSEWMAHINKCIGDLIKKSGKTPSREHAAVWVPDSEAPVCMHCKKSQFNVLNRRHHCRKCGLVVCGPCSNKKFMLPHQSTKPLRVCLTCYDLLSRARTGTHGDQSLSRSQLNGRPNTVADGSRLYQQDSSGEDDSDDEDEQRSGQTGDASVSLEEPTFYADSTGTQDKSNKTGHQ